MLVHCVDEMKELAAMCRLEPLPSVNGWTCDVWRMEESEVEIAISSYNSLLQAGLDPDAEILEAIADAGIDVASLLAGTNGSIHKVTRADLCELVLGASMLSTGSDPDRMLMPNIPKMSRSRSDSGVDIFEATTDETVADWSLKDHEKLWLTSVKHTIKAGTSDLRSKLTASVSPSELNIGYMYTQLRWLSGQMERAGWSRDRAARLMLFLRHFPHPDHVSLMAGAVVDTTSEEDLLSRLEGLPDADSRQMHFRVVSFPGLKSAHDRCL